MERFMRDDPLAELQSVCRKEELLELQALRKTVYVHPSLLGYLADLIQSTRKQEGTVSGVSPRGTLAMLNAVRAHAMLQGRGYVVPEDVKRLAEPVLSHRIVMEYGSMDRRSGARLLRKLLDQVPVPTERFES